MTVRQHKSVSLCSVSEQRRSKRPLMLSITHKCGVNSGRMLVNFRYAEAAEESAQPVRRQSLQRHFEQQMD